MADFERLLVSRVIQDKDLTDVADAGITPSFFGDPDNRSVFQAILRHKGTYGEVPSLGTIKADFPTYKFVRVEDSMQVLTDRLREQHTMDLLEQGLAESVDAHEEGNADKAMAALAKTLADIAAAVPNTRDTDLTTTGTERLARYLALKDLPDGLRGIPSGFATIDRATQGFQKGQLITFVGPPKAGKSTLLLLAAMAAHLFGVRVLFINFEMSNEEQEERYDAIRAGISHARLRNGTLKKQDWDRLEKAIREIENMPSFFLSSDTMNATTLTGVQSKIETLRPDIVIVDGIYMMQDELGEPQGSPQALTNLTRGFKRMAKNQDKPIIISTQVLEWKMNKKKGITSDSIGYSSSFAQDSDAILGVEKTEDANINKLKVVLARNCPPLETFVQWDWETGRFEELNEDPFAMEEENTDGWQGSF
ncbi:DnaB-like helicase C-terminal domain-containing protein [Streptomyces sp. NPDC056721]|uniref:DnaB-like helicase C-terminal domain-containing protein n=1 Tax=Streptomyces sp. NPDC056721 TaxID=3345923 RepID=UPI0036965DC0